LISVGRVEAHTIASPIGCIPSVIEKRIPVAIIIWISPVPSSIPSPTVPSPIVPTPIVPTPSHAVIWSGLDIDYNIRIGVLTPASIVVISCIIWTVAAVIIFCICKDRLLIVIILV
jgi:hypothetical protein